MAHRKLQQEVDKVFKKINEGLDVFDMYYERHESCTNNPSQKDKLESDLKREVKKLQRLREQIKSWQSSPEIKDKDVLLEHRRRVEIAMEKYKAVEKASKEKAYSNISLKRADTLDPEAKERLETEAYLSKTIDELDRQHELLDVEIDRLQVLNKKKKTYSQANEDKIKEIKDLQLRYRWHQQQIELALRLLANEELSPQKVIDIKDDINYFVENNQEDNFIEDETIYDNLDLLSNEAIAHEVSQYFASQISEDNKRTGGDSSNDVDSKPVIQDTSKLSKKELRKLEREAKKAAKLAAKNAAAEIMSQGPTLTVKMGSKPLPPLSTLDEKISTASTPKTNNNDKSILSTSSPLSKKVDSTSSSVIKTTTEVDSPSSNIVHTHIHQGTNGITGSTVLKPATIPAKPVGDMKWSTAVSQSLKKEEDKQQPKVVFKQPSQQSKIKSNDATPLTSTSTTPRLGTPVLSNNNNNTNISLEKLGQLESLTSVQPNKSTPSTSSAATAAAVLAAGAAAVNQNNQQFHKYHPLSSDQLNKVEEHAIDNVQKERNIDAGANDTTDSIEQPSLIDNDFEGEGSSSSYSSEDSDDYDGDSDELFEEPQYQTLSTTDINIIDEKRTKLEEIYNNNFELLSLPNGINEFIMGYELTQNKIFANDGKLGGYRHSIDTCKVPRLSEIPLGVNPPNPLDAFRSTQQWDIIRSSMEKEEDLNQILEKFRGMEMFTLFYNYYFAVLPIEKKIAFELLKEKNWKIGTGETMWFLRQGDVKMQNELFELADYKIFKLDDWSVVDKINFRLDYSNLKYPDVQISDNVQDNGASRKALDSLMDNSNNNNGNDIHSSSLSPNQSNVESLSSPNSLSHGQQLLQQLKRGKMTSNI